VQGVQLPAASGAKKQSRLRLKGLYAPAASAGFDPLSQDTSLQIADTNGTLFCTTIAANHWQRHGRNEFLFRDGAGSFAGGLSDGRFRRQRAGAFLFTARGKRVHLRPTDGQHLVFTLRVGSSCSQSTVNLRQGKAGLVSP